MFPRALPIYRLNVCVIALALLAPCAVQAQLPDAPLPVVSPEAKATWAAVDPAAGAGNRATLHADWLHSSSRAFAASNGSEIFDKGQQSLPRRRKQPLAPGFSFATAEHHPVPGTAPALRSACPSNSCSLAQSTMCCGNPPSPFARYLSSPDAVPLTARDNLNSAVKNVIDPFNLMTIGADAAIGVASDSHSVYGPGAFGIAKYAGVSLTEDMTGEFFGTFLVPSLVHQDPHYHREPFMPVRHRILHAITQVVWAKSYSGRPMFNYANIVGGIATAAVSNTFVPGPGRQGFGNTAQRLALAFAISPSGNLIEEFVPDLASRINLRVVIFQRILNTVSVEESGVR